MTMTFTRIVVDAMGSDRAPEPELEGVRQILAGDDPDDRAIAIVLVGDRDRLAIEHPRLHVHHATQVIAMDDHPVQAVRGKPDASLRVAIQQLATGAADAAISAGNSGAVLAAATMFVGRSPGVDRPAIVAELPVHGGARQLVLCDAGANVEPRPTMLAQFARLGAAYARATLGRTRPRVGLLANGSEPAKGTELTRATHALLAAIDEPWDYVGYVEGNDLFGDHARELDVVATDGFTGNVVLKTVEGLTGSSYTRIGGALLAGIAKPVVLAHGRSDAGTIANAIRAAARFARANVAAQLALR